MSRTILNLVFLCSPIIIWSQAQRVNSTSFDEANLPAIQLELTAPPEVIIEWWETYWDDRFKVDIDREDRNSDREIYRASAVQVAAISDKQLDIYSKITTTSKKKATVFLGVGFGYDVYAGPDNFSDAYEAAETIMQNFEAYFYQNYYGQKIEALTDELDDARDEKEDLERDIEKSEKQVERWLEKMEKLNKKITENREEKKETREALTEQKAEVDELEQQLMKWKSLLAKWL